MSSLICESDWIIDGAISAVLNNGKPNHNLLMKWWFKYTYLLILSSIEFFFHHINNLWKLFTKLLGLSISLHCHLNFNAKILLDQKLAIYQGNTVFLLHNHPNNALIQPVLYKVQYNCPLYDKQKGNYLDKDIIYIFF